MSRFTTAETLLEKLSDINDTLGAIKSTALFDLHVVYDRMQKTVRGHIDALVDDAELKPHELTLMNADVEAFRQMLIEVGDEVYFDDHEVVEFLEEVGPLNEAELDTLVVEELDDRRMASA